MTAQRRPISRRIPALTLLISSAVAASAAVIPVGDLVGSGAAVLTASPWDIGSPNALFDGDWGTIYRTDSVSNPALITVEFSTARTFAAARGRFTHTSTHEWTLEAADSFADLDAATGSYVRVFGPETVVGEDVQWRAWHDTPVTARVIRFTILRVYGDNHVHIRNLELHSPEPVEEISVGGGAVPINVIELTPDDVEIAVDAVAAIAAEGSFYLGPDRYDLTDTAAWSADDSAVADIPGNDGVVVGVGAGATTVRATIGVVSGAATVAVRAPRPVDLDAPFIHRTPEYNRFMVSYDGDQHVHPDYVDEKKWPDPGELVTWTAHVFNRGDAPVVDVEYRWCFDGDLVRKGTIAALGPLASTTVELTREWPADTVQTVDIPAGAMDLHPRQRERAVGEHRVRFELDPGNEIAESCELNNVVDDPIHALVFWLFFDETSYRRLNRIPNFIDSYSAEDWCRMQLAGLERRLRAAGCSQEIRLDMVSVLPDGSLSTGGTHEPVGSQTRQADGRWGFQISEWSEAKFERFARIIENPLMHEWGHQIGLIDVYQYDIATGSFDVTSGGSPVADTARLPRVSPWNVYYGNIDVFHDGSNPVTPDWTGRALMADVGRRYVAPGSAAGMNRNLGLRRGFFGDYLGAVPQGAIRLRILCHDGSPVVGCPLRVFQRETDGHVHDTPKFAGTTDASGEWVFPSITLPGWHGGVPVNNPWSWVDSQGVSYDCPHAAGANAVLVVELDLGGGDCEYHFVEVDRANLAMADGITGDLTLDLVTYRSRLPNQLPVISLSDGVGDRVALTEGQPWSVTVSAVDPDGDPVVLSATPLYNSTFTPATGRFTFRPDSLQVNLHDGYNEAMWVDFIADDGRFRAVRRLWLDIADDPAFVGIDAADHDGDAAGDVADPDDDNDGVDDEVEIRFHLDPFDPQSVVRIVAIEPDPDGAIRLRWPFGPTLAYLLEWATGPGAWDEVDPAVAADVVDFPDGSREWTDHGLDPEMNGVGPGDAVRRIYRVTPR